MMLVFERLSDADEMVVDRAGREQHRDRRVAGIDVPIAQDNNRGAFVHGLLGLGANAVDVLLQRIGPFADRKRQVIVAERMGRP